MKYLLNKAPNVASDFSKLLSNRAMDTSQVKQPVSEILARVKAEGDTALCDYTTRFDRRAITPDQLRITENEIDAACKSIPNELQEALEVAYPRVISFHKKQFPPDLNYEDQNGFT